MSSVARSIKPQRLLNESFEDYKDRRREGNKAVKKFLNGRMIWSAKMTRKVRLDSEGKEVLPWEPAAIEFLAPVPEQTKGAYIKLQHGLSVHHDSTGEIVMSKGT